MKRSASLVLAAVLALSGATAASAASHMSRMNKAAASDTLSLSGDQQKSIWKDISAHAASETAPSGFTAAVGTQVPNTMSTYPLPRQAARDVPAAKPYRYAMTQDKVILVNPSDHKIADVVTKP